LHGRTIAEAEAEYAEYNDENNVDDI
jgi:hypothetical protein